MKILLILVAFTAGLNFNSDFNYTDVIEDEITLNMLESQFVMDCTEEKLYSDLEKYMVNYFDDITHITGHYAKSEDLHYYTVFGKKDGKVSYELLAISQALFSTQSYFDTSNTLLAYRGCRMQPPIASHPRACRGDCAVRYNACFGVHCPPADCLR